MEACSKTCDEFTEKVQEITSHSSEDNINWKDKIRLQFEEKGITAFKHRLGSYKSTISIALGLLNFQSSDQNRQVLQDLHNIITTAVSEISGQMEGLEIGIQSLASAGIANDHQHDTIIDILRDYEVNMQECLKMCTSPVDALPAAQSSSIKSMEVFDKAKQFVVLTTGKSGLVETMSAHQEGRQFLLDKVKEDGEGDLVEKFFHD